MIYLTLTLMCSITLNQIDNITAGELTKVLSDILSDPSFFNEITSIMSQQVAITIRKTIQAACRTSIETLCKKINPKTR